MKNLIIGLLLGTISAEMVAKVPEETTEQMEELCKDYEPIDQETLVALDAEEDRLKKHTTFQNHAKIARENRKILATEHKCAAFIKHH